MRSSSLLPAALVVASFLTPPARLGAQGTEREGGEAAPRAPDQTPARALQRAAPGERSLGIWVGGAPTSYAGHFIGATPGRAVALAGLRFGLAAGRVGPLGVEYVAQLIPLALAYNNPVEPVSSACASVPELATPQNPRRRRQPDYCRRRIYGAGVMPVGAQVAVPLGAYAQAFVAGNAGAVVFARNVPVPQARRFNFAFDFGGGLELGTRRVGAVTVGYKLHHLSNAWTAPANPGIDHHVFYAGVVRRVGARPAADHKPGAQRAGSAATGGGSAGAAHAPCAGCRTRSR